MLITLLSLLNAFGPDEENGSISAPEIIEEQGGSHNEYKPSATEDLIQKKLRQQKEDEELIHHLASAFIICQN